MSETSSDQQKCSSKAIKTGNWNKIDNYVKKANNKTQIKPTKAIKGSIK